MAAKLYLLLYDTDVDLIFITGGSKTTRYGMDFSRNRSTNFEIHGELAFIEDFAKRMVGSNGNVSTQTYDAWSYLLGIRYLTEKSTTYILEYFYNGAGYTGAQMDDFYSFVNKGYDLYLNTRNSSQINNAANLAQGGYGRNTPQREYLYLRVSQLEPCDILYFTPAITMIMNATVKCAACGASMDEAPVEVQPLALAQEPEPEPEPSSNPRSSPRPDAKPAGVGSGPKP